MSYAEAIVGVAMPFVFSQLEFKPADVRCLAINIKPKGNAHLLTKLSIGPESPGDLPGWLAKVWVAFP